MKYKGYQAIVEFSEEDNVFFGKIAFLSDLVTFEGTSVQMLEENFHKSVDDYLETCEKIGKKPEKMFKGSFNIRISPVLHRKLAIKSLNQKKSLNKFIEQALEKVV